jgi:PAS domain S-box-containing protein
MTIRIKTKLFLGFGFFLSVITLIWIVGALYINRLAKETRLVIKDNYESIEWTKHMIQYLDEMKNLQTLWCFDKEHAFDQVKYSRLIASFESYLLQEESNITEYGEKEASQQLRANYSNYISTFKEVMQKPDNSDGDFFVVIIPSYNEVKNNISEISEINMNAIVRKSNYTQKSAEKAFMYISIIGTLCFFITFSLFFNFPGYIANPIKQLTKGIKEIARKNYQQRLFFKSNDEFGELAEAFNVMAERLDAYENSNLASVLSEKRRVETIINNMNEAILVLNEENKIIFCNKVATGLLGVDAMDIIGQYAPDIAARNDLFQTIVKNIFLQENGQESNVSAPLKIFADGKESFFTKEIHHVYFPGNDGSDDVPIGYVIVLTNITRFQELDAAKTNFIATVSHEIKTPISSIKMSIKLLEDQRVGHLNHEQKQLIHNISEETRRLLGITGELLEMTQVETGNIRLDVRPVNPLDILTYSHDTMRIQAENKHVDFILDYPQEVPQINADMEKTTWVLINLISNAIRYSPEKAKINLSLVVEAEEVIFSVRDQGCGIDPKYQEKIFEKYFRVPGADMSGSGLGLAISREFINEQGGRIWIESELEKGSKFSFTLPVYKG